MLKFYNSYINFIIVTQIFKNLLCYLKKSVNFFVVGEFF